jgi:hypothetical protein
MKRRIAGPGQNILIGADRPRYGASCAGMASLPPGSGHPNPWRAKAFSAVGQSCELQPRTLSGTNKSTRRVEPNRSRISLSLLCQRACPCECVTVACETRSWLDCPFRQIQTLRSSGRVKRKLDFDSLSLERLERGDRSINARGFSGSPSGVPLLFREHDTS